MQATKLRGRRQAATLERFPPAQEVGLASLQKGKPLAQGRLDSFAHRLEPFH